MSTISKVLPTPPDNFSTQIASATVSSTALTVQLDSVAGLPTEGVGQFFKKDANGDIIAGSIEFVHWTNIAGSSITFTDTGDRGITGSDSGAQSYVADDYFEVWVSSYYSSNYSMDVEHNSDGTHDNTKVPVVSGGFATTLTTTDSTNVTLPTSGTLATTAYVDANVGGDWRSYTAVTPTSGTLDSPSFEFTFAGVDLSTTIYPGMRLKVTQGTVKYFIVTKVAFSTNTTITAYGGTDYSLVSTGTTAITAFSYSSVKAPSGFPLDPTKWTVELSDTTERSQTTPASGTWYNIGTTNSQISMPIGIWNVQYSVSCSNTGTASDTNVYTTLSTANNSESNTKLTSFAAVGANTIFHHAQGEYTISATAKTTYYLNAKTTTGGTIGTLYFRNTFLPQVTRLISAYL